MEHRLIKIHQMIMIGAAGQNCGKTTLASELIKKWRGEFPVIALKITTIQQKGGKCMHAHRQCGVCTNISDNFELLQEVCNDRDKDTSVLLASGADKVYWLRSQHSHLEEGIHFFMSQIPGNAIIICESNSLRAVVEPGLFIMLKNAETSEMKPSAKSVIEKADVIAENDFQDVIRNLAGRITAVGTGSGIKFCMESDYNRYTSTR